MKKITIIAIIFMALSGAYAQTSLNPAKIIGVNLGGWPSSTFNKVYNQSNFIRAWNRVQTISANFGFAYHLCHQADISLYREK